MKKFICIFLSALLIISVFAACSTKLEEPANDVSIDETALLSKRKIDGKLASFSAQTIDGKTITQDNLAKYDLTIINFWGTYCSPCIREMKDLEEFRKSLPGNVRFLTVCVDASGNEKTAQILVDEYGLKAPVIKSADGDFESIMAQITLIPTTIFISGDGSVVGKEIIGSPQDLDATYNEHLKAALAEIGA